MPIHCLDFPVLRTPLLPYSFADNLSREKLHSLLALPMVQEAIFIASPNLYTTLQEYLQGNNVHDKKNDKLAISLAKYLLRMCYRCTPFGLFAGITPLSPTSEDSTHQPEKVLATTATSTYRHTRLDMDYLCALAYKLGKQPEIRAVLRYFPNNTLYEVGESLRYAEYRLTKRTRNHFLVSIDNSEYVQRILTAAQHGETLENLAKVITDEEITFEEAFEFINEMVDSQVLVSELEPNITDQEYFEKLLSKNLPALAIFPKIQATLQAIDTAPLGTATHQYYTIAEELKTLGTDFELGQLFQVDIKLDRPCHISEELTQELQATITLLLQTTTYQEHGNLKKFRELFYERYETQEVSLLQVLDNETGFGYPASENQQADNSPLLNGIGFRGQGGSGARSYDWTGWQQFLVEKFIATTAKGETVIHLTKEEIEKFKVRKAQKPANSLYCFANLIKTDTQTDNPQTKIFLKGVSCPSAATLLGRFCHLDKNLTAQVKEALATEASQRPDTVFAEIVHINQGRIGNVSMRPQLRPYEIPIVIQASTDQEHTILLEDLYVSIRENRIFLRSKRLNKEVIPRLSSAHNFGANALPFYHFLCDLQYQNYVTGYYWNWGALDNMEVLPRVVVDNKIILAKARWILKPSDLQVVEKAKGNDKIDALRQLLAAKKVSRWVIIKEGDNELPIDTHNDFAMQVLLDFISPHRAILLEENLFNPTPTGKQTTLDVFTNEFIFPLQFIDEEAKEQGVQAPITVKNNSVVRNFAVGSEWLFVKIYCGVQTADKVLLDVIKPFVEELVAQEVIDKWFFIRYADPQSHIRLRLHRSDGNFGNALQQLHTLLAPYLSHRLVTNIETAIYKREIERYGSDTIEIAESIFCADSNLVVNLLPHLGEGDYADTLRWQFALVNIDQFLNAFGFDLLAKKELLQTLQNSFQIEFGVTSKDAKKMLGDKFRAERKGIEALLMDNPPEVFTPIFELFQERNTALKAMIELLVQAKDELEVPLNNLLGSYIHMNMNRLLRSKHRLHELMIYDMLAQFYTSLLARNKAK
jgi:thiopeptide-type bacteriocin biosynthesis protein